MSAGPELRALLIGVDHYPPPDEPGDAASYRSLSGCVHDVSRMERFLVDRMGVPARRIRKLTASDPPAEPDADRPTYENMVAAFQEIARAGRSGDQVLIHYSGHGGRTPTRFPRLKLFDPYDEALVPTDVARPDSQYLRDVELAYLLAGMIERGLFVTLIFDCCHAGGAAREREIRKVARPVARHNRIEDWRRARPSLVAPDAALAERWRRLDDSRATVGAGGRRDRHGWLPRLDGYVMLAACRSHEQAYEYSVAPGQQGGALTHWLLDTLEQRGTGLSWQELHDRVYARIHDLLEGFQHPVLEGAGDRRVFSAESVQRRRGVNVLRTDGGRALLNAGQAQGVRRGARFAVFAPGWANDDLPDERRAVVEVDELGGAESWARVVENSGRGGVEAGAVALPLDGGSPRRRRTVRIDVPGSPDRAAREALEVLAAAFDERRSAFLEQVGDDRPAERTVTVGGGVYRVLDRDGRPLPHLPPDLTAGDPAAARRLVDGFEHLARYRNVEELRNHDAASPLFGKLEVDVGLLGADYDPADPPDPAGWIGRRCRLRSGDWLVLRMRNLSSQVLNFTVLDLQPRWSIRQIHPQRGDYRVVDPEREERLVLQASLPAGASSGRDLLKVFATVDPTHFHWLELPVLGDTLRDHRSMPPRNVLEEFLLAMADGLPRFRDMTRATAASREWIVEDVEIEIEG